MSMNHGPQLQEDAQLRRGPWTLEEDSLLVHYIASYGEGRWNHLARSSGLKRTGKSCRLRWLNYLKPDVKRGNLTLEEQLLIIELHSKWGNRWSRIAQRLPGRTDNEIKNYWRTRVQKQTRQLGSEPNNPLVRTNLRVSETIENPNSYRYQEALSSASQPLLGDACSWHDLYFSPQKFLSPPSIISGPCSGSSSGQYNVGNCFWTVDEPLEIKRLN